MVFNENKHTFHVHSCLAREQAFLLTDSTFRGYLNTTLLVSNYFTPLEEYLTFIIFQKKNHKANNAQEAIDRLWPWKQSKEGVWGQEPIQKLKSAKNKPVPTKQ